MKKGKDYGLLIASMVAIVAIVGLVIMFSSGTTGAAGFEKKARTCISDKGQMLCFDDPGSGSFEKTARDNPRIIREAGPTFGPGKPETS